MPTSAAVVLTVIALCCACACTEVATIPLSAGTGPSPELPTAKHRWLPTINVARAAGWPAGSVPIAASGLTVTAYARGLEHPRWLYVLPNGDVLVAETNAPVRPADSTGIKGWAMRLVMRWAGAAAASGNRITVLHQRGADGLAAQRSVLLDGLHSPFGMALVGEDLYVAETDALRRYHYVAGMQRIAEAGVKVMDLPAGPINHHWTKNVIASPDGATLYVTVGSNSNVGEHGLAAERGRAAVWTIDLRSGASRVFASGLRNPNGLAWEPSSGALWVAVNERDELGSDLVPDYMTALQDGAFYGWPFSYYGGHVDERVRPQDPGLVARARIPDYALGAHTASLGLAWSEGGLMPAPLHSGMFVAQHGSWNRRPRSGYRVVFVPFDGPRPSGAPVDVLTGFIGPSGEARGRPVGAAIDRDGGMLIADDVGNTVWRVTRTPK